MENIILGNNKYEVDCNEVLLKMADTKSIHLSEIPVGTNINIEDILTKDIPTISLKKTSKNNVTIFFKEFYRRKYDTSLLGSTMKLKVKETLAKLDAKITIVTWIATNEDDFNETIYSIESNNEILYDAIKEGIEYASKFEAKVNSALNDIEKNVQNRINLLN